MNISNYVLSSNILDFFDFSDAFIQWVADAFLY